MNLNSILQTKINISEYIFLFQNESNILKGVPQFFLISIFRFQDFKRNYAYDTTFNP